MHQSLTTVSEVMPRRRSPGLAQRGKRPSARAAKRQQHERGWCDSMLILECWTVVDRDTTLCESGGKMRPT